MRTPKLQADQQRSPYGAAQHHVNRRRRDALAAGVAGLASCLTCKDLMGDGINCPECQKVRGGRHSVPASTPPARRRFEHRPEGRTSDPAVIAARHEKLLAMRGRIAKCGVMKDLKPAPRPEGVCPTGTPPRQSGRAGLNPKPEDKAMATYPCRNPKENPKCAGTCAKDGGLCRSCGILEARPGPRVPAPGATGLRPDFLCAEPGCLRRVKREGHRCPNHRARSRAGRPTPPAPPPAPRANIIPDGSLPPKALAARAATAPGGDGSEVWTRSGPGPITVALARMIEEAAATSPHVAARLTVDRASRTIHIEVDLAAEAPAAAAAPARSSDV